VHSAGEVRDLAWTRPCNAVSRLTPGSRRSHVRVRRSFRPSQREIWQSRS